MRREGSREQSSPTRRRPGTVGTLETEQTMKLVINLALDNAAFEESGAYEVGKILADVSNRLPDPLEATARPINLRDSNGNIVGTAEILAD